MWLRMGVSPSPPPHQPDNYVGLAVGGGVRFDPWPIPRRGGIVWTVGVIMREVGC